MLEIKALKVEIEGKMLLQNISLTVPKGETHVLFGPNGAGKSSLLMAILGLGNYKITEGSILFKGEDITNMPTHERINKGIGIAFQRPPAIAGLKTHKMVEICAKNKNVAIDELAHALNLDRFLQRDINVGFSGGEVKRSEILQLLAQDPDLLLLDEPESGVDLENIALIGKMINQLLCKDIPCYKRDHTREKSCLIITHTGHILDYIRSDKAYILCDGVIHCHGNPKDLLENIQKVGYEKCIKCYMETM